MGDVGPPVSAEVVVLGATAAGVMAAVAAAEEGASAVLVSENGHVGGMVSGGLGKTDVERAEPLIGGLARRFFTAVGQHYGEAAAYRFEPSVAEATMERLLSAAGVTVVRGRSLGRADVEGRRISRIVLDDGTQLLPTVAVDATYEGALLQASGVRFAVGREGRERYGEPHAGRVELLPNPHQFRRTFSAESADANLLPGVVPYENLVPTGAGDGLVQSYCYRVCLTDDPANRRPLDPPAGYDANRYTLLDRYLETLGADVRMPDLLGVGRTRNGKTDVNSGGPVSTNLLGASQRYPTAGHDERRQIAEEHRTWAEGLLYLLRTDAAVPAHIRDELGQFGLPRDEFIDTGGWPHQLYVRESVRMLGAHVLTEHDLRSERSAEDSIGMGGYNIDIREVQWVAAPIYRFPDVHREAMVEGYLSAPVPPYTIPYRSLLPERAQASNLLVPICISASHVAFSSFRMEPQYMIAGESAGVAAAIAAGASIDVHDVPIDTLTARLRRRGQILRPREATDPQTR